MVFVGKEASACSHMTWRTASHPPSANTTRRAAVPTGRVAGKSAHLHRLLPELAARGALNPSCGAWVLMRGQLQKECAKIIWKPQT